MNIKEIKLNHMQLPIFDHFSLTKVAISHGSAEYLAQIQKYRKLKVKQGFYYS